MLKFAFRNLFRQKGRTAMTLAAITFGVIGIILSGGFVHDIFLQLRNATIHSRLGYIQIYRQGYYERGRRDPYKYMIASPGPMVAWLNKLPGVTDVMQRLYFSGLLNNGNTDFPVIAEGIQPDKEAKQASFFFVTAGHQLRAADKEGIIIGEGVAKSLQLKPGSLVTLVANTPDGELNSMEFKVVGVFRTFSKDYDARAVRIPLAVAKQLLNTKAVHSLVLSLDDARVSTDGFATQLRKLLKGKGYEVKTWLQLDDYYPKTVAVYKRLFGVLQLIILIIVLLSVANSVSMTAYERVGEFGTLKALGKRSRDVFRLILVENALLGLFGATLGVSLGVLIAVVVSRIGIPMPPPPNSSMGYIARIRVVPFVLESAFVIGVGASIASAALAGRGAARVPIVDALRQNI